MEAVGYDLDDPNGLYSKRRNKYNGVRPVVRRVTNHKRPGGGLCTLQEMNQDAMIENNTTGLAPMVLERRTVFAIKALGDCRFNSNFRAHRSLSTYSQTAAQLPRKASQARGTGTARRSPNGFPFRRPRTFYLEDPDGQPVS